MPLPTVGLRILLVDDDPAVRLAAARWLRVLGHRVLPLPSATAALAVLQAAPDAFDLVITDTRMPGMSGLQLIASVRDLRPRLPVVRTSGDPADRREPGEPEPPPDAVFLGKPFSLSGLADALEEARRRVGL